VVIAPSAEKMAAHRPHVASCLGSSPSHEALSRIELRYLGECVGQGGAGRKDRVLTSRFTLATVGALGYVCSLALLLTYLSCLHLDPLGAPACVLIDDLNAYAKVRGGRPAQPRG
jgi:hypothetical protein